MRDPSRKVGKMRIKQRKRHGKVNMIFESEQNQGDREIRKLCLITTKPHSSIEAVKRDLEEQIQAIKQDEGWKINSEKKFIFMYNH